MHEVVLMAVRKAVSAATRTFTANSMIRCFFMVFTFFGGAVARGTASFEAGGARLLRRRMVCAESIYFPS